MSKLTLSVLLFMFGQTLIWFQTNGQFAYEHFDGLLWPGRFLGFALGISSYALLTWYFMGEGISWKTATSLILSIGIIFVQLFWK